MVNSNRPTGVTADRTKRVVIIGWDDGHESEYSFDGLRQACPCAECKGGHANMGAPPDPRAVRSAPETDLMLDGIETIGAYALQFNWSDGHWTGIYTWENLRGLCPCSTCVPD